MIVSLIAALAANRVIGRANAIPWDLPADRCRFRELTMGHLLIMGRRTWESIGRPLPGRQTIVVSRQPDYQVAGTRVAHSLAEALAMAEGEGEVFICGGGHLYIEALPLSDRLYLTELVTVIEGDTFFPELPPGEFREVAREEWPGEPAAVFRILERVR
ncbi:MAG TPA: dihydrofolate reductase [Geobacteraceae bacterium]